MRARRIRSYAALTLALCVSYALLRRTAWQGSAQLHTVMEAVATTLAAFVGMMALVRYYSRKNNTFLFVGVAFLGTALLDGYHAVVTSSYFMAFFPSELPSLIPWSWVASRVFLGAVLWFSCLAWRREDRLGPAGRVREGSVYLASASLTVLSFLFFVLVPLPRAYFAELPLHRPEELVPAAFFLLALIGYLRKDAWARDPFEHWLVLSLIVGFMGQAMFMSFSGQLFDGMFDAAHLLKKMSYVAVLTGLAVSMYHLFLRARVTNAELEAQVDTRAAEIKTAQAALHVSEAQYRDLYENAPDMYCLVDAVTGAVLLCNDTFAEATRLAKDEIVGRPMLNLYTPDTRAEAERAFKAFLHTGELRGVELRLMTGDDSGIDVSLDVSAVRDEFGEILHGRSVLRDISLRKEAEEAQLRYAASLEQSNRELQDFAYVASHDLQEPLRKIQAFGDLLVTDHGSEFEGDAKDYLRRMQAAAARAQSLIGALLKLSRVSTRARPFEDVPLSEVADDVVEDLDTQISAVGGLVHIAPLPTVIADPSQIHQLLQNLIANALTFHHPERPPRVRVEGEIVDIGDPRAAGLVGRREWCVLSVQDNGVGFDEKHADRIFTPFQRLHSVETSGGTGIGLAICKRIVELHGGRIEATSSPDGGATFVVVIPAASHSAERVLDLDREVAECVV